MIPVGHEIVAKTKGWCKRCTHYFHPGDNIKFLGFKSGWGHRDCRRPTKS